MRVSPFFFIAGKKICERVPRFFSYWLAQGIAQIYYLFAAKDKQLVRTNMDVIFGRTLSATKKEQNVKAVFANFAWYLVDFFAFSRVDGAFIKKYISVEGRANLDAVQEQNKGIIILSAHLGNWELGGIVASKVGYPMHVIALPHVHQQVNEFFNNQRGLGEVKIIPLGTAVRRCIKVLKERGIVAFLGDREFGDNGVASRLFGQPVLLPPGPAYFAIKTDACIIPSFMVRERKYYYRLVFEKAISIRKSSGEVKSLEEIIAEYAPVMERYIRDYATQWYMFSQYFQDKALYQQR